VRELDALAGAQEKDGVVADHVAAADGVYAYLARGACARLPLATVNETRPSPGVACDLRQADRGSARGIDLHPVVRLHDLDVEVGPQHRDRLRRERAQDVDPDAHVRLPRHGDSFARARQGGMCSLVQSGRPAHDGDAGGRGDVRQPSRRSWRREVDDHLGARPGERLHALARVEGDRHFDPLLLGEPDDGAPHASARANDRDAIHLASAFS